MPFAFKRLDELPDVVLVEAQVFADARGWFKEAWQRDAFASAGIAADFVQDNAARSTRRGVLRGLHYQLPPRAQGKLVEVVEGEVFDVAVDLRRDRPTFGRCATVVLRAADHRLLWVPPGFAHGYVTLSEASEVRYKVTAPYSPAHDRAVRWDDPALAIPWPVRDPVLSAKDAAAPLLRDAELPARWEA